MDEIDIKSEEEKRTDNGEFEADFYGTEDIFEDSTYCDPETVANTPIPPTNASNSNLFSNTKFICDICGQQFNQKSHMGSHMMKHSRQALPKSSSCGIGGCTKSFSNKKLLNDHRLKMHKKDTKEEIKLKCHLCPKSFTIQYKLDAHIRYHQGLKVK